MPAEEKIPQTIHDLISEIGERMVLFELYNFVHHNKDLEMFKNYSERGFDIGIRNIRTGKRAKIEVKTRQRRITTSPNDNIADFSLTENERNSANFLVGYWMEKNDFFIVPVEALDERKSKKKLVYKHVVTFSEKGKNYTDRSKPWINNWPLILNFINKK